jgi:hypothetical protein
VILSQDVILNHVRRQHFLELYLLILSLSHYLNLISYSHTTDSRSLS